MTLLLVIHTGSFFFIAPDSSLLLDVTHVQLPDDLARENEEPSQISNNRISG